MCCQPHLHPLLMPPVLYMYGFSPRCRTPSTLRTASTEHGLHSCCPSAHARGPDTPCLKLDVLGTRSQRGDLVWYDTSPAQGEPWFTTPPPLHVHVLRTQPFSQDITLHPIVLLTERNRALRNQQSTIFVGVFVHNKGLLRPHNDLDLAN